MEFEVWTASDWLKMRSSIGLKSTDHGSPDSTKDGELDQLSNYKLLKKNSFLAESRVGVFHSNYGVQLSGSLASPPKMNQVTPQLDMQCLHDTSLQIIRSIKIPKSIYGEVNQHEKGVMPWFVNVVK